MERTGVSKAKVAKFHALKLCFGFQRKPAGETVTHCKDC